jgi:endo-1,4-beta-mannosidase
VQPTSRQPPAFELGINYWPRRRAMYMWREFDLVEVRDELAHIADIGFDTVRLFALTQDFLPAPDSVAPEMISRLVEVTRAAKEAGLGVVPTLIVLNMSGRIWWPAWMLDARGHAVNLFSDPAILRSQARLAGACASALAGDASVRAIDIANEVDDAQRPASRDAGWLWASVLAGAYAWCYADYDPRLFTRPPLATAVRERTFGLVRADGSEKPAVGIFRELRKHRDAGGPVPGPVPRVLDVSADEYYRTPGTHFDRLYAQWLSGIVP